MGKKKKGGEKKGKKPHKNMPTSKKYAAYAVDGEKVTTNKKHCIKCGPGVFLADHKDRKSCGKCGYTEFAKREAPVAA